MTENEKDAIRKLRKQGLGYGKIAQRMGMNKETVKSFCRRNGLDKNGSAMASVSDTKSEYRICKNCGKAVLQILKRKEKKFCCDDCRHKWWNEHQHMVNRKAYYDFVCPCCGKRFQTYGDSRRKYCSHECYIADRFGTVGADDNR